MGNNNIDMEQPLMVTITCTAYNHEAYIRQCLDGFVMQKTNFRFEAIVHDDASTDHTADIIREYAAKYPDIIKPIYETENQYSKHNGSLQKIMSEACKGKYRAMCEGDDYWTDPLKLQKQVDFMEEHEECSMTCSRVKRFSESKQLFIDDYGCYNHSQYIETIDVIEKGGLFISTCSIIYRNKILDNYPEYCKQCHVGDYPLQIMAAMKGRIFYFNEIMAVYRVDNPLSWVGTLRKDSSFEKKIKGMRTEINMLQGFCLDYPSYKKYFENRINAYVISNFPNKKLKVESYREYRKEFKNEIKQLSLKDRINLFFPLCRYKRLYYIYKKIESKL